MWCECSQKVSQTANQCPPDIQYVNLDSKQITLLYRFLKRIQPCVCLCTVKKHYLKFFLGLHYISIENALQLGYWHFHWRRRDHWSQTSALFIIFCLVEWMTFLCTCRAECRKICINSYRWSSVFILIVSNSLKCCISLNKPVWKSLALVSCFHLLSPAFSCTVKYS